MNCSIIMIVLTVAPGIDVHLESSAVPPADTMLHEASRRQLRERPNLFARPRLINLRAKLPTLTEMELRLRSPGRQRPRKWWKLW